MESLSVSLLLLGRAPEARELAEQVVLTRMRVFGEHDPDTIRARAALSGALVGEGNISHALDVAKSNAKLATEVLGPEDPSTLLALAAYAALLAQSGNVDQGIALTHSTLQVAETHSARRAIQLCEGTLAQYVGKPTRGSNRRRFRKS
jgi:hypothetical protein